MKKPAAPLQDCALHFYGFMLLRNYAVLLRGMRAPGSRQRQRISRRHEDGGPSQTGSAPERGSTPVETAATAS